VTIIRPLKIKFAIFIAALLIVPSLAWAYKFEPSADYSVCFTPGGKCATRIVNQINKAENNIQVIAYSFTNKSIAGALVKAKNRGVNVEVVLDKTQVSQEKYSSSTFLDNAGIPIWIDYTPTISHNKVMTIDGATTITGSFNFTQAAQNKNAENLLIIHDKKLTEKYIANWEKRKTASMPLKSYKVWQQTHAVTKNTSKIIKKIKMHTHF
jgi:phosphatidylserine/phosphatidylglycerophosphate/cardiolipin synthase-like enzyme